jgi:hypothetical protein
LTLWNEVKLVVGTDLTDFSWVNFDLHGRGRYFDDRETGDGTALERAATAGLLIDLGSDPRRQVTGGLTVTVDGRQGGGIIAGANGYVSLRALSRLELALLPTAAYESGAPRYVAKTTPLPVAGMPPPPPTYQFGTQTAASVGATLRASYTFTPELSLQYYTQLFLARVHYDPLFMVTQAAGGIVRLADLYPLMPDPGQQPPMPDSQTATLNVNIVLRWEYRLGSTFFLVYTRAQNPALAPSPTGAGFEWRPLLQGRAAENVLMAKLAYWFG